MAKSNLNIGIIGLGFVGGVVHYWFKKATKQKTNLFLYDKNKNIGSLKEVNKADLIFICVPTPYHRKTGYDDSAILESLNNLKSSKIVVIKSTVLPGSTEKFQKRFPNLKIFFNPEFLRAKTAKRDFVKPDRQIVGYTLKSKSLARMILKILPKASFVKIMRATEAEMVKYFCNAFLSTKVIFANQIYDLCEKLGINYDAVKEAAAADPRIGSSHLNIFFDGYRGYGGACFPKDTKAFIDFSKKLGVDPKLLKAVDVINNQLIKKSNEAAR